ncbi:MAG TPA: hypothetical protein VNR20_03290 [Terriglobales bacterium]|nr:hypothetical protein [Terriglobales bacterium]
MTEETWKALRGYLERLGAAEYAAFRQTKAGRKKKARYQPTDYHRELVRLLGEGNEEGFKALKALQGPYSALGV